MNRLKDSTTYKDFKRLFNFGKNIEEFDNPVGLTLSDNSFLRYLSFAILYFAQGVPSGLLTFAVPAWMAMVDYSAMDIGKYLAIVTLPWTFKLLAAPIMDRFSYLPMGRRRPWIIFGQTGVIIALFILSTINPHQELMVLIAIGFTVNFFVIFQDISVDGLAIDVLPEHQQARANGLMWGSRTLGQSIIVAITLVLFSAIGFGNTVRLFASLIAMIMLVPILVKERPGEKRLPWSRGKTADEVLALHLPNWKLIISKLFKAFLLPVSLFMAFAIFSFGISRGFMDAAFPVFTVQEMGWIDNQYPEVLATAKLLGGILGMFVGGAFIDFVGKKRASFWLIFILILSFLLFVFFKSQWENPLTIKIFLITFTVFVVFLTIVMFAIAMQLCWKQVAATQFTLYMTISNLGQSFGSYLFGNAESWISWEWMFLSNVAFLIIMFGFIKFIDFDKHKKQLNERLAGLAA
jgi:PAT family beta-lactamase induction signal transducer AmpG